MDSQSKICHSMTLRDVAPMNGMSHWPSIAERCPVPINVEQKHEPTQRPGLVP